jgi:hypothetical protein
MKRAALYLRVSTVDQHPGYMPALTTIGDLRSSLDKVHLEAKEIRKRLKFPSGLGAG